MTLVLGCDPGGLNSGHTGIVLISYSDTEPASLVDSWAVPDNLEGFRRWYQEIGTNLSPDVVVCERFVNRNLKGSDLSPLLIEGVVRWVWPDAVMQMAAGKNTGMPDAAMKRAGFDKKMFQGDHHQDRFEAARHVLLWLKKQRNIPTMRKAFPNV